MISTKSSSYLNINEMFVTEGGEALLKFREEVAQFSLHSAASRLSAEKKAKSEFSFSMYRAERKKRDENHFSKFGHLATQVSGSRPISSVSIGSNKCLTGSWCGDATLWDLETLNPICLLENGYLDSRLCSVLYKDHFDELMFTGDSNGLIRMWRLDGDSKSHAIGSLSGHQGRVSQMVSFPHNQKTSIKICSASGDTTWRIWDVATESSILLQEGHSKDVNSIDVHPDGALVVTGGFDANGIVWDVRIGRPIFTLKGHSDAVVGVSFSANGILIASGSQDNTARIWDLRMLKSAYKLLAHTAPLTGVKFSKSQCHHSWGAIEGSPLLLTTSQDMTAKLWASSAEWAQVALLAGHSGKVMQGDISEDARTIVTVSYDRTLKLWQVADAL
ncbi:hypothetical protein MDAP_001695 [Mitosporidium daphniae]